LELLIACHDAVLAAENPKTVLQRGMHLLFRRFRISSELIEVIEKFRSAFRLLGDERKIGEAEFIKGLGEMKNVHLFRVFDFPADGPVFVHFESVHDQTDKHSDSFLLFAFLVRAGNEFFEPVFDNGTPVFRDSFQPPLHQLSPAAFGKINFVGVDFGETGLYVLLDGLSQGQQGPYAFAHCCG
jgi:hypothetical protein